jgi:Zn-dependent oligopeptidase
MAQVLSTMENVTTFPQHVSADKALRDECTECENLFNDFGVECGMRYDVYTVIEAFSKTAEAAALTGEDKRLLAHTMRDYRRNGMHMDEKSREQIKGIKVRPDFPPCRVPAFPPSRLPAFPPQQPLTDDYRFAPFSRTR